MRTAQTTKNLAQQIAKQVAQEPFEILKTATGQLVGSERAQENDMQSEPVKRHEVDDNKLQADRLRSARQVEALNREIVDIKKQDLFKDLQKKIADGEEIYIENYPELSSEQKDVLRALVEVAKNREVRQSGKDEFTEPAAKKGRQLFNFGKKTAMKREQTHVEKPVPPSG